MTVVDRAAEQRSVAPDVAKRSVAAPGDASWGGVQSARALSDPRRARSGLVRRGGSAVACRSDRSSRGLGAVVLTTSCPLGAAGVDARRRPAGHSSTRRRFAVQGVQAPSDGPKSRHSSTRRKLPAHAAHSRRRRQVLPGRRRVRWPRRTAGRCTRCTATATGRRGTSARAGTARPPSAGSIEVASSPRRAGPARRGPRTGMPGSGPTTTGGRGRSASR